ncbi:MAG: hypothetical protein ACREM2_11885 [Vulcanimicrobiaceae bacterium]
MNVFLASGARNGAALLTVAMLLAACAPKLPLIRPPDRVSAHCGTRQARLTGVDSVLTSTNDRIVAFDPSRATIARAVGAEDGVMAYWNDQPLILPKVAAQVGERDQFVHVFALGVPPPTRGETSRMVFVQLRDHGRLRWVVMQAFDVQDACVEGQAQP